jgi:hypothetical protein
VPVGFVALPLVAGVSAPFKGRARNILGAHVDLLLNLQITLCSYLYFQ